MIKKKETPKSFKSSVLILTRRKFYFSLDKSIKRLIDERFIQQPNRQPNLASLGPKLLG